MERMITNQMLLEYKNYLQEEEKSETTIAKYLCDLKKLMDYADEKKIDKSLMITYKKKLLEEDGYQISSINSFLVAANRFFEYKGWYELKVKTYKIQKEIFCPEKKVLSKEEYKCLVETAKKNNNLRLAMILETICATGMRVSELSFITVSAVKRNSIEIRCKGKIRTILLPDKLRKELLRYIYKQNIKSGSIFCTSSGKAVNRSNIWREMKALCEKAGVLAEKVFPHNLRHLFAKCFYELKKDIAKLADVLGHSSIETTRIYIRTTGMEYQKELNKMNLVWALW